jgi:hypothetical protein
MVIGQRQRHRDVAIVLLAEPPAVLPRYANRVLSPFGEACVMDDPQLDRPCAVVSCGIVGHDPPGAVSEEVLTIFS